MFDTQTADNNNIVKHVPTNVPPTTELISWFHSWDWCRWAGRFLRAPMKTTLRLCACSIIFSRLFITIASIGKTDLKARVNRVQQCRRWYRAFDDGYVSRDSRGVLFYKIFLGVLSCLCNEVFGWWPCRMSLNAMKFVLRFSWVLRSNSIFYWFRMHIK